MPRRITSGRVGRAVLGDIVTQDNALQSVVTNANVVLEPNGTGVVEATKDLLVSNNAGVRFSDGDTNYAKIVAPSNLSANYTLTLPTDDGGSNQVLATNGSGTLSWTSVSISVNNRSAADGNTYYIAMIDQTSGAEDTISVASDRISFVPNPGLLTVNSISTGTFGCTGTSTLSTVDINGGNIDGTTIGSATRANGNFNTMTATTITEDSSIRLKENVNPIDNALDSILSLVGVTYDRKDGSNINEAGLIAEEVNTVLPNIVKKDEQGNPESIMYTKLTAYLIEAVKTLKAEVDSLKGK
jgi:hypothetical protein